MLPLGAPNPTNPNQNKTTTHPTITQQMLATWCQQHGGLDAKACRLTVLPPSRYGKGRVTAHTAHTDEDVRVKDLILRRAHELLDVAPDDADATEEERKRGWKERPFPIVPITASFRGVELPTAIAPVRLAACVPAPAHGRAPLDAIAQAFDAHLAQTILPFALGHPLDAPRAALVGKACGGGSQGVVQD